MPFPHRVTPSRLFLSTSPRAPFLGPLLSASPLLLPAVHRPPSSPMLSLSMTNFSVRLSFFGLKPFGGLLLFLLSLGFLGAALLAIFFWPTPLFGVRLSAISGSCASAPLPLISAPTYGLLSALSETFYRAAVGLPPFFSPLFADPAVGAF